MELHKMLSSNHKRQKNCGRQKQEKKQEEKSNKYGRYQSNYINNHFTYNGLYAPTKRQGQSKLIRE